MAQYIGSRDYAPVDGGPIYNWFVMAAIATALQALETLL